MSGPSQPSLPADISIISYQSIPFPKELTEKEMMEMTLEQLEEYSATVSTSIGWEYSTLQSYQQMQDSIDASILQSQSTISGYDVEIAENKGIMDAAISRKKQLDTDIEGLDVVISQNVSSIAGYDTEIGAADKEISSLEAESAQLGKEIEEDDRVFVAAATNYSTLVYDYLAKELTYYQQISSIQAESTFLAAAEVEEAKSQATYNEAAAAFATISAEVEALTEHETALRNILAQAASDEAEAQQNLENTNITINTLSTIYETSLNVQKYYQAVAVQTAKIEAYTNALALYNEATRVAELYPTQKTYQDAKAIALGQLNAAAQEKDKAATDVSQLQAIVNLAQDNSYEAILKGYQDTIDLEARNVSTFGGRRMEAEAEVKRYSTLYEEAERDIKTYTDNIALYTEQYTSSIQGADVLTQSAQADEATLKTQQDLVNLYKVQIATYTREYEEHTSKYNAYMAESTLMKKAYDDADLELQTYSTFYESTVVALDRLTTEEEQLVSSITMNDSILKTQSSFYERELVKQESFQALINASIVAQELASVQYRETYVRAKRLAVQELYNAKILQEVQAISTQNGTTRATLPAGAPFVPRAVDLNVPTLKTEQDKVTTIQGFLNTFDAIYGAYNTQLEIYNTISTIVDEKRVALEKAILYSEDPAAYEAAYPTPKVTTGLPLKPAAASRVDLNAAVTKINTQIGNAVQTAASIKNLVDTFSATYTKIFAPDEIIAHNLTISSFLEVGYASAAAAATGVASGAATGAASGAARASGAI